METAGKLLLVAAAVLAIAGLAALVLARLGVERLPFTLTWHPSEHTTVAVPVGLMIVLSVVGTILLNIFFRR